VISARENLRKMTDLLETNYAKKLKLGLWYELENLGHTKKSAVARLNEGLRASLNRKNWKTRSKANGKQHTGAQRRTLREWEGRPNQ